MFLETLHTSSLLSKLDTERRGMHANTLLLFGGVLLETTLDTPGEVCRASAPPQACPSSSSRPLPLHCM